MRKIGIGKIENIFFGQPLFKQQTADEQLHGGTFAYLPWSSQGQNRIGIFWIFLQQRGGVLIRLLLVISNLFIILDQFFAKPPRILLL